MRLGPAIGLTVAFVPVLAVLTVASLSQGCSSSTTGASPPAKEAGGDDATTPAGGEDSGVVVVPYDAGGCIGADAGVLALTSDSKPISFVVAAENPATGDWQGQGKYVAQVFSANGAWTANLLHAFDQPNDMPVAALTGMVKSCTELSFSGAGWTASLKDGSFTGSNGSDTFTLQHVLRKPPTLGAAPPANGTMLFDGTNFDNWVEKAGQNWLAEAGAPRWKIVDGAMEVVPNTDSLITKQAFGDAQFHIEFRVVGSPSHSGPFPEARYQVTVLSDYGLYTGNTTGNLGNEYTPQMTVPINPTIRAGRAPLEWQTLDIDFHAPKFSGATKTANASMSVKLNGVKIFDNQSLGWPVKGAAARFPEAPTGPLLLEYHGMPVQYRNIWVAPLGQ